jgi:5-methylcytosine-specific restriction endonuclease McrA
MDLLNDKRVLRLNANYQRLGFCSGQDAFIALMGENADGSPPALALDIYYNYDEFGKPIIEKIKYFDALDWEFWLLTEPRKGDLDKVIHTSKRIVRIPTVLVCPRFRKMPMRQQKATPSAIYERDGNKCVYSGIPLTNKTRSLDHVIPRSKGGENTWENLVACHRDINSKKGDKFNHEIGLKIARPIPSPRILPLCSTIKGVYHPDHEHF